MAEVKKRIMIMTGWGLQEYAPAAAMLLKYVFDCNGAEVQGVSQRYLPEALKKCENAYSEVYVLGIGLENDPKAVAAELRKLKAACVKVWWISKLDIPGHIKAEFLEKDGGSVFGKVVVKEGDSLLNAVQAAFPKCIPGQAVREFGKHLDERLNSGRSKAGTEEGKYRHLFVAADWKHKNDREMWHYKNAIFCLAKGIKYGNIGKELTDIVAYYDKWGKRELIGTSPYIQEIKAMIDRAAREDEAGVRVLITGTSGTGKETVAQMIHRLSSRKDASILSFNCACTTTSLFECKLFGSVPGAYTDARGSQGLFETAANGTLFLDEVAELNFDMQGQLLRVLQDGDYLKVGETKISKVDNVRIIAATNKDLVKMVREGTFREDLYYRLNVLQIRMKPLAEHAEDIPLIARTIWRRETGGSLTKEQCSALAEYSFPGNARELENMLTYARVMEIKDFNELVDTWRRQNEDLHRKAEDDSDETVHAAILRHVAKLWRKYQGIKPGELAERLDKSENTVRAWLRELKLIPERAVKK